MASSSKTELAENHFVLKGNRIQPPYPEGTETCVFGTGCFWGSEKGFWRMPGVYSTAVGYTAGATVNPAYREVCSGRTGHNEVVQVVWNPKKISYADILRQFWQSHDPTQGNRQGNDRGTQYRSGIYPTTEAQRDIALKSRMAYQKCIDATGKTITTEVLDPGKATFYYAEDYHQQYLAKPGARPYCSAQPLQIALAPINQWAPDCGVKNLLPPSYWAKHSPKPHCVIGAPNEQIKLAFITAASAPVLPQPASTPPQPASKPIAETTSHPAKLSKDDDVALMKLLKSSSKPVTTSSQEPMIVIITTDFWSSAWYEDFMLKGSRHAGKPRMFFDISDSSVSFEGNVEKLRKVLSELREKDRDFACLAVGDAAMNLYSAVVESFLQDGDADSTTKGLKGASFPCFFLATNKLACREQVAGCGGLKSRAVRRSDKYVPDLGVTGFFKPLAEASSKGVMRCETGVKIPNPFFGSKKASTLSSPIIKRLALKHSDLKPYLDEDIVGIVEEYVDPTCRKVSIDGFVHGDGKVKHYCISANIYKVGKPEEFDSLVTPAQDLSAEEVAACWDLYDKVAADFVRRGLRDQFLDVEAFLIPGSTPSSSTVRAEVMEVNCRPYSNQLPSFSRIFGDRNSLFSAAIDLLEGREPPIGKDFADSLFLPKPVGELSTSKVADSNSPKIFSSSTTKGKVVTSTPTASVNAGKMEFTVGVCAYLDYIEGAPCLVHASDRRASYYAVPGHPAHVYAFGRDASATRRLCDKFHALVKAQYENGGKSEEVPNTPDTE